MNIKTALAAFVAAITIAPAVFAQEEKKDYTGKDWGDGPLGKAEVYMDIGAVLPDSVEAKKAPQGFALYKKYGFSVHDKGQVVVVDLNKKSYAGTFQLPGNPYHCNNAVFGPFKATKKSDFPLLYVSECVSPDRACNVYDISISGGKFSARQVQRIVYTGEDVRLATDWFVDREGGFIYTYAMSSDKKGFIRITKFRLPSLSDSDSDGNVVLTEKDRLSWFDFDKMNIAQGSFYHNGEIYLPEGAPGFFCQINCLDASSGEYIQTKSLEDLKIYEPESLDIKGKWIYLNCHNCEDTRHNTIVRIRLK